AATLRPMLALVFLLVLVPVVELAVFIQVASAFGVWNTLAVLIAISLIGFWIVRRQGMGLVRRAQLQMNAGRMPGKEAVDGFLVLCAGVLLLVPGFVTDALGILLLIPPVRAGLRALVSRRWRGRVEVIHAGYTGPIDTTATERRPPELGAP
ncbi:MAG TPA: FxsA family protein, partial [Acidimicrobiales bacterium]